MQPTAQLKCLYTNARSMGNKQRELEATMLQESYDLVVITETWCDESHDWSAAINGYNLFRRDRQGRRARGVALYVKNGIVCEELSLKNSHKQVESLWVRIRDRGNKGNLVVGVYYRLPNQGEPIDKAFLLQLQEASCSQALILLEDFNYPNICWKSSTDLALGLAELHEVRMGPFLKPVKVRLDGIPSNKRINCTTQLGVICKFAEGALNPTIYVINEEIKYYLSQYEPLRDTTCYWFLFGQ
ncbi:hypothetical protein QYF61_012670 [Mycteria americana]|uniref:Endonuclease/exonuclease/phosphatase domain-containing protein n=1 Tax=Mycteria americana TaxID=33587 RepID=A0AAN7NIE5_MYCAM|nr:hypothetical protein QYF61_012670 [Mycteria americana]